MPEAVASHLDDDLIRVSVRSVCWPGGNIYEWFIEDKCWVVNECCFDRIASVKGGSVLDGLISTQEWTGCDHSELKRINIFWVVSMPVCAGRIISASKVNKEVRLQSMTGHTKFCKLIIKLLSKCICHSSWFWAYSLIFRVGSTVEKPVEDKFLGHQNSSQKLYCPSVCLVNSWLDPSRATQAAFKVGRAAWSLVGLHVRMHRQLDQLV